MPNYEEMMKLAIAICERLDEKTALEIIKWKKDQLEFLTPE